MDISEEELEKLVEKKVEERLKEKENKDSSTKKDKKTINRRQFLKMAGLGVGAIGLSSATSAWSILQPSAQGISDITSNSADRLSDPSVHDASEFSGSNGASGQILKTDGSNASWSDFTASVSATDYVDESSNRSLGSWYQNTTGNPLLVYISASADPYYAQLQFHVNTTQNNRKVIHHGVGTNSARSSSSQRQRPSITAIVPDNHYYKLNINYYSSSGFHSWFEQELTAT